MSKFDFVGRERRYLIEIFTDNQEKFNEAKKQRKQQQHQRS